VDERGPGGRIKGVVRDPPPSGARLLPAMVPQLRVVGGVDEGQPGPPAAKDPLDFVSLCGITA